LLPFAFARVATVKELFLARLWFWLALVEATAIPDLNP